MNEKELMKKYPGEMIDPHMLDEEAKRSQYMYGSDLKTTFTPGTVEDPVMPRGYIEDLKNEDGSLPVDFSKPCNAPIDLYTDEAMEAYKAIRGPLDFSLEKELVDINNEPPKRVAIIGGPRNIASLLIHACESSGIEMAQPYDHSELIGNPDMKTLNPATLSLKHLSSSAYASGTKPRIEDLSETMRKDMRKAQNATNKANGFGKRLTKKDKLEMAKKASTNELNFTTTAVDMEWRTTATVKDGKITDLKVTDIKHTLEGECKDID